MRLFPALFLVGVLLAWCDADPPRTARGQVLGAERPIEGARVRFKGTPEETRTDVRGRFDLRGRGERVTAWKEGHFISGVAFRDGPLRIELRPLPAEDYSDYEWVHPRPSTTEEHACGNCHRTIHDEWAGSAHGRAGRNRRFLGLHDGADWHGNPDCGWSLRKDHPSGTGVCAACHAPTVPFNDPGFDRPRKLTGVHAEGVHCDYCHKIADAPIDKLGLEHGRYAYQLLRPKTGQLFFGPLDDVDRGEDAYSELYRQSRYCASCHEGTIFGTRVYTTYSEWLQSPARKEGKECQSCHMTPTGKMTNIAPGRGGIERDPRTLASHQMIGASQETLRLCLRLEATLEQRDGVLSAEVRIKATNVGHRVPTGFIDRHLLLVVEPLAAKGERVKPLAGPTLPAVVGVGDPARGDFAGLPGRFFGRQLEDAERRSPVPFWRPNREVADTRLHPEKIETLSWRFHARDVNTLRARLIYRRFFKTVADEKGWPDNEISVVDERLDLPEEGKTREWRTPNP